MPEAELSATAAAITAAANNTVEWRAANLFFPSDPLEAHPPVVLTSTVDSYRSRVWDPIFTAPDEFVSRLEVRQRQQEEYERRQEERKVAAGRAVGLLKTMLTPAQRASYEADRSFLVVGSAGNTYRIRDGSISNVEQLNSDGRPVATLCAHPVNEHELPNADVAVAQMLALVTNENAFRNTAHIYSHRW